MLHGTLSVSLLLTYTALSLQPRMLPQKRPTAIRCADDYSRAGVETHRRRRPRRHQEAPRNWEKKRPQYRDSFSST